MKRINKLLAGGLGLAAFLSAQPVEAKTNIPVAVPKPLSKVTQVGQSGPLDLARMDYKYLVTPDKVGLQVLADEATDARRKGNDEPINALQQATVDALLEGAFVERGDTLSALNVALPKGYKVDYSAYNTKQLKKLLKAGYTLMFDPRFKRIYLISPNGQKRMLKRAVLGEKWKNVEDGDLSRTTSEVPVDSSGRTESDKKVIDPSSETGHSGLSRLQEHYEFYLIYQMVKNNVPIERLIDYFSQNDWVRLAELYNYIKLNKNSFKDFDDRQMASFAKQEFRSELQAWISRINAKKSDVGTVINEMWTFMQASGVPNELVETIDEDFAIKIISEVAEKFPAFSQEYQAARQIALIFKDDSKVSRSLKESNPGMLKELANPLGEATNVLNEYIAYFQSQEAKQDYLKTAQEVADELVFAIKQGYLYVDQKRFYHDRLKKILKESGITRGQRLNSRIHRHSNLLSKISTLFTHASNIEDRNVQNLMNPVDFELDLVTPEPKATEDRVSMLASLIKKFKKPEPKTNRYIPQPKPKSEDVSKEESGSYGEEIYVPKKDVVELVEETARGVAKAADQIVHLVHSFGDDASGAAEVLRGMQAEDESGKK